MYLGAHLDTMATTALTTASMCSLYELMTSQALSTSLRCQVTPLVDLKGVCLVTTSVTALTTASMCSLYELMTSQALSTSLRCQVTPLVDLRGV